MLMVRGEIGHEENPKSNALEIVLASPRLYDLIQLIKL